MNLQQMREAYVGNRVELPGRGVLACSVCGSHMVCYNVVPYTRMRGQHRDMQVEEISGACLRCTDPKCGSTSVLPLTAKTVIEMKLHAALPEQLQAVQAWLWGK